MSVGARAQSGVGVVVGEWSMGVGVRGRSSRVEAREPSRSVWGSGAGGPGGVGGGWVVGGEEGGVLWGKEEGGGEGELGGEEGK